MSITVTGFEETRRKYIEDKNFGCVYADLLNAEQVKHPNFSIHDGKLLRGAWLHLLATSIYEHVRKLHVGGGCRRHLDLDKILALLCDRYLWPHMKTNVVKICELC